MRPSLFQSLRGRLALLCFLVTMTIAFLLLSLFFSSEVNVVTMEDQTQRVVEEESYVSTWVALIMFFLTFPIALLSWIWAGVVVRPIVDITHTASDIQLGSLDRRIDMPHALVEFQNLAQQFNRMMDRLAEESKIQAQLIENTSHEIRTPLAILATNTEVMLADPAPSLESYGASTELTAKTVSRLRTTVEELLSGATFTSMKIGQIDNDLSVVAHRVASLFREKAQDTDVVVETSLPNQLLCAFDGSSVERALSNLLDNAIRFSPPGGVVTITVGKEKNRAFASVEDNGKGIDTAEHDRVFDRYFSSADGTSSHQGIGLAIVKQVASAHDGISLESPTRGDHGTRFTLWFQL